MIVGFVWPEGTWIHSTGLMHRGRWYRVISSFTDNDNRKDFDNRSRKKSLEMEDPLSIWTSKLGDFYFFISVSLHSILPKQTNCRTLPPRQWDHSIRLNGFGINCSWYFRIYLEPAKKVLSKQKKGQFDVFWVCGESFPNAFLVNNSRLCWKRINFHAPFLFFHTFVCKEEVGGQWHEHGRCFLHQWCQWYREPWMS